MSDAKTKFPRSVVEEVFLELWRRLDPQPALVFGGGLGETPRHCPHALCERLCAVGGFRRGKAEMKDLELLYIPRVAAATDAGDLFGASRETNLAEDLWQSLIAGGVLSKRLKENGAVSAWGPENKHALHVASGLPLDLFSATAENWHNRLVVTTGPRDSNVRIAAKAREKGWEWEVYDAGFVPLGGTWAKCPRDRRMVHSERDVFAFMDMECPRPEDRK